MHLNKKYYNQFFKENYGKQDVLSKEEKAQPIELGWDDEDSFWLSTPNPKEGKKPIKIRLDIRVLPDKLVKACPVGAARG